MAYYKCGKIFATQNSNTSIETASGAIANFNTSLAMPVLGCNAEFSASQASGTPTPAAPIPIVGVDKVNVTRTGKNLVDIADKSNITIQTTLGIVVLKAGTYALSANVKNNGSISCYLTLRKGSTTKASITINANEDTRKSTSFTLTETDTYTVVCLGSSVGYDFDVSDLQIEFGSTATTYEAPTVVTALVNLGGTYYGGSVDAVTGKITLTHDMFDLGNLSWSYATDAKRWRAIKRYMKQYSSRSDDITFEKYATDTTATIGSEWKGYISGSYIYVHSLDGVTPPSGNAVYPLATPIVVYASNTAELYTKAGLNNVFCDTGDIEVKYRKLYSDH